MRQIALWVAQGFGIGRIPLMPGTFGSLLGLAWFALLLKTGHLWLFVLVALGAGALSVWLCGIAENVLQKKDPASVVLDEITAMPICFTGWLVKAWSASHSFPVLGAFFTSKTWYLTAGIFVLFRIFDIAKPWPIGASQSLAGGWGVTVDDFLAAFYVAIFSGVGIAILR